MASAASKFLYRCTKESCGERVLVAQEIPAGVRVGCPNCQCPIELVRGPEEKIPENFPEPVRADGTKLTEIQNEIDRVIVEREATHGDFATYARIVQRLKNVVRYEPEFAMLEPYQREAIEHIFGKIGRIMAGNSKYTEHWLDIAGYATLVKDRLTRADAELIIPASTE